MFEVHGWAAIRKDTSDSDEIADSQLIEALKAEIEKVQVPHLISIHMATHNGLPCLSVAGCRNHRYELVIALFHWLAQRSTGSYGLLYVWDQEDFKRGGDYQNCFRVWRLARGKLEELNDPFLSPCIPTIEDGFRIED